MFLVASLSQSYIDMALSTSRICWHCIVGPFAWELRAGTWPNKFRLECVARNVSLVLFDWELLLGSFRLLEDFSLGEFVRIPRLGIADWDVVWHVLLGDSSLGCLARDFA